MTQTIETFGASLSITEAGHTHSLVPGSFVGAAWTPADLSAETQAVREAAAALWTPAVVSAYRADMAAALGIGRPKTAADVNIERERRIAVGATVTVTGAGPIPVQGREQDVRNLQGLGLMALARVSAGDTSTVTVFRDAANVDHDLTPPQVLELVQGAAAAAEAIIQASWTIKAMDPLPDDVTADELWPVTETEGE